MKSRRHACRIDGSSISSVREGCDLGLDGMSTKERLSCHIMLGEERNDDVLIVMVDIFRGVVFAWFNCDGDDRYGSIPIPVASLLGIK